MIPNPLLLDILITSLKKKKEEEDGKCKMTIGFNFF